MYNKKQIKQKAIVFAVTSVMGTGFVFNNGSVQAMKGLKKNNSARDTKVYQATSLVDVAKKKQLKSEFYKLHIKNRSRTSYIQFAEYATTSVYNRPYYGLITNRDGTIDYDEPDGFLKYTTKKFNPVIQYFEDCFVSGIIEFDMYTFKKITNACRDSLFRTGLPLAWIFEHPDGLPLETRRQICECIIGKTSDYVKTVRINGRSFDELSVGSGLEDLIYDVIDKDKNIKISEVADPRRKLEIAILKNNMEQVNVALDMGVNIEELLLNGRTPLCWAILQNGETCKKMVELLLKRGAKVNPDNKHLISNHPIWSINPLAAAMRSLSDFGTILTLLEREAMFPYESHNVWIKDFMCSHYEMSLDQKCSIIKILDHYKNFEINWKLIPAGSGESIQKYFLRNFEGDTGTLFRLKCLGCPVPTRYLTPSSDDSDNSDVVIINKGNTTSTSSNQIAILDLNSKKTVYILDDNKTIKNSDRRTIYQIGTNSFGEPSIIYDQFGTGLYQISKDAILDYKTGKILYKIQGNTVKDATGRQLLEIRGNKIYDRRTMKDMAIVNGGFDIRIIAILML